MRMTPHGLVERPCAVLRLMDPIFKQSRARRVTRSAAKDVNTSQVMCQLSIVVQQLGNHVLLSDGINVVISNSLQASYMAY